MQDNEVRELLLRYAKGECTDAEIAFVETWVIQQHERHITDLTKADIEADVDDVYRLLQQPEKKAVLWPRAVVAAAAVAAMVFGIWFYSTNNGTLTKVQDDEVRSDIAPGKQGATLTLGNGKKIRLSDAGQGILAKETDIVISKTADGQLIYEITSPSKETLHRGGERSATNTLSTAKGETYMVILPDKSKVWLNTASSLTYNAVLNDAGKRVVKLSGEAYFEITKDKGHPFVVKTNKQEVEVLGTHFNVNSYADEGQIKTTLLEGSVKVSPLTGSLDKAILTPGQQSIFTDKGISVVQADAGEAVAWKNGYFRFDEEGIESIMRKLSRWYNIEVYYDGPIPDEQFSGRISRYKDISQALGMLDYNQTVHFKIEGRRITVTK